MRVESESGCFEVQAGQVAVLSPHRALRLTWSEHCEQIIVRVPHALLRPGTGLARGGPQERDITRVSRAVHVLQEEATRQWTSLLQSLLDTLPQEGDGSVLRGGDWTRYLEDGLALFTRLHLRGDTRPDQRLAVELAEAPVRRDGSAARVKAAESWAMRRLCAPLSLEDLARAAGVSPRTFHMDCMRQSGRGPMGWLRDLRLDEARRRLSAGGARVTEVATDCGFGHLGRFSAYYRERFGERPSETVPRVRD